MRGTYSFYDLSVPSGGPIFVCAISLMQILIRICGYYISFTKALKTFFNENDSNTKTMSSSIGFQSNSMVILFCGR